MKISIEGYKSIAAKRSVELPGLTILAGANSSGKSSFMQPFLLIKQTLENDFDAGALFLDGPNVELTDSSEIIPKVSGCSAGVFSIACEDDEAETSAGYKFDPELGVVEYSSYQKSRFFKNENGLFISRDQSSAEIKEALLRSTADKNMLQLLALDARDGNKFSVYRNRCFLGAQYDEGRTSFGNILPIRHLGRFSAGIIHIPGLRGMQKRTFHNAAIRENAAFPGLFERYVASIIHSWQTADGSGLKLEKLLEQLRFMRLATSVKVNRLNDSRLEVRISRLQAGGGGNSDLVNIADVGFGVSQVLPVLVALLVANENQVVYIEQPELHLHPRAQHALASVIAEAVTERKVRVVLETHSSILIRGVQILVAKGQFPAEKVSLNWFTQNLETGQTDISEAKLDKLGAFGDWPEDFDAVALDVERMYLDAVEEAIEHEV